LVPGEKRAGNPDYCPPGVWRPENGILNRLMKIIKRGKIFSGVTTV
jgi:hypothetical protein